MAGDDEALGPQEMAAAYRAAHGENAPWLTRKAWEAGQLSTATGTVRTAPWYLAATAAKKDGRPMSAVPRYLAAARMDATAGQLRDHRDPLEPGDDSSNVADALSDAAAAMRAGDPTEAREAIKWARGTIAPGSSLHPILNEHEIPVVNLAGPTGVTLPPSAGDAAAGDEAHSPAALWPARGPDFPAAPTAPLGAGPGRRAAATRIASRSRQARPGRLP
jgi:hypothetical protein